MEITTTRYICDRCGEEIKYPFPLLNWMSVRQSVPVTINDMLPITSPVDVSKKYVEDNIIRYSGNTVTYFNGKSKTYDLCQKCFKELKMFLKGKSYKED